MDEGVLAWLDKMSSELNVLVRFVRRSVESLVATWARLRLWFSCCWYTLSVVYVYSWMYSLDHSNAKCLYVIWIGMLENGH